jgi:error-prone DNA polymerase
VWEASALRPIPALLRDAPVDEKFLELPPAPEGEEILFDYASTGLTLRQHPLALLRPALKKRGLATAVQLRGSANGARVSHGGLVTLRQQPGTAKGVIFVSLEDETGAIQVIVWKGVRDAQRNELLHAKLLAVHGTWQREGEIVSLIAQRLEDLTPLLGRLAESTESRDFR